MKKLLIVTNLFPPINAARSIRMCYVTKYLSKLGWNIDVITRSSSYADTYDESLLRLLPKEINVYRSYSGILNAAIYASKFNKQLDKYIPHQILKETSRIIKGFQRRILIPDETLNWVPFAVYRALQLIKRNNYDILYSNALPFTSHIVGYIIKRMTGITWLLEYGDPFSYNTVLKLSKTKFKIYRLLEEIVLKSANGIILMTEQTRSIYLEKFRFLDPERLFVVPSGYDQDDYPDSNSSINGKFKILYTGSLGTRVKRLDTFFNVIKRLSMTLDGFCENHEIILMGYMKKNEVFNMQTEQTKVVGTVNFLDALGYMKSANVLLLIGNEGGLQIPSKAYYYLGAKKPILVILGNNDDPLKQHLADIDRVITAQNDEQEIADVLKKLYELWQKGILNSAFDYCDIDKYTWETSLKSLNNFIEDHINNV